MSDQAVKKLTLTQAEAEQLSLAMFYTKSPEGWPEEAARILSRMGFGRICDSPPGSTVPVPASFAERLDKALDVTAEDWTSIKRALHHEGVSSAIDMDVALDLVSVGIGEYSGSAYLRLFAEFGGIPGPPTVDDGDLDVFETVCQDEPVYFGTETRAVARRILEAFIASRREEFGSVPTAAFAAAAPEPEPDGPKTDPAPEQPEDAVVTVADRFASAIKPIIEGVLGLFGFLRRGGR